VDIPYITYDTARLMHDLGLAMVQDDASDIGYFRYRNRRSHRYHGKKSPTHDSYLHHWMWGGLLIALGELAGLAATMREAQEALKT
jgi:hypothetical protein